MTKITSIIRPLDLDLTDASPLYLCRAAAGWPSPAEDYVDKQLNLHEFAVKNQAATFFSWAAGDSMIGAGIFDGDLLVVDRSVEPVHGCVVVAAVEGEMLVKYFRRRRNRAFLAPGNPAYPEIEITGREDAVIWGVVTYVLHKPRS